MLWKRPRDNSCTYRAGDAETQEGDPNVHWDPAKCVSVCLCV